MGISVRDLLNMEFFRDFHVIAGRKGLDREIQGVSLLEAPEAHLWSLGKELLFSSGYVFSRLDGYLERYCENFVPNHAALVIKRGRYLAKIPDELIKLYDKNDVPLITMPYSHAWMTVINQVNVGVLNQAIHRLRIDTSSRFKSYSRDYKEQAIQKILKTLENEMEFPAFLYDIPGQKSYYSSSNFQRVCAKYGLTDSDFLSPPHPYTVHTLCDCINMKRYRLMQGEAADEPRISWVVVQIQSAGLPQAVFGVMESRKFMDFYDEYSMRIAYLMLQGIYDQHMVARDASNMGFENLIHLAMECEGKTNASLTGQAGQYGLSMEHSYYYALMAPENESFDLGASRMEILELFHQCKISRPGHLALLSAGEGLILLEPDKMESKEKSFFTELLTEFHDRLRRQLKGTEWLFAICRERRPLTSIRTCVEKTRKVLATGRMAKPKDWSYDYDELGILTWLSIPDDELKKLLEQFSELTQSEKNRELLYTLKIYLENNMNFSLTAEKLFINVNTIRRRIEKANELVPINWDNYFERTKLGLMLQYLNLNLKERRD